MVNKMNEAPDIDIYQIKKALKARIHSALVELPRLFQRRQQQDSIWRIAECLNVTEGTYDHGRLPVYYGKPRSPRPKKFECVRALATFVVVKWWDYSLGRNTTPFPTAFITQLEQFAELGLGAYQITGNPEIGFKLEKQK